MQWANVITNAGELAGLAGRKLELYLHTAELAASAERLLLGTPEDARRVGGGDTEGGETNRVGLDTDLAASRGCPASSLAPPGRQAHRSTAVRCVGGAGPITSASAVLNGTRAGQSPRSLRRGWTALGELRSGALRNSLAAACATRQDRPLKKILTSAGETPRYCMALMVRWSF